MKIFLFLGRLAAHIVTSSGSWRIAPLIFLLLTFQSLGALTSRIITSRSESLLFMFSFSRSGAFSPLPQDQVNANIRLTTIAMTLNLVFRIFLPWGLYKIIMASATLALEKLINITHSVRFTDSRKSPSPVPRAKLAHWH